MASGTNDGPGRGTSDMAEMAKRGNLGLPAEKRLEVSYKWEQAAGVDLVPVEHLQLQQLDNRVYMTFGQVAIPLDFEPTGSPVVVAIQPVARLVATHETFLLFAKLLAKYAEPTGGER